MEKQLKTAVTGTIPESFTDFINDQALLTVATSVENTPYCATCFYSFFSEQNLFVIRSDRESRHIREALISSRVAGTINPATLNVGEIVGIQFQGNFAEPEDELLYRVTENYCKKFPFAAELPGAYWIIRPDFIKLTDNRKAFASKAEWQARLNFA